jgi:FlaA1/EpsC-like NDP-sugar epimerase
MPKEGGFLSSIFSFIAWIFRSLRLFPLSIAFAYLVVVLIQSVHESIRTGDLSKPILKTAEILFVADNEIYTNTQKFLNGDHSFGVVFAVIGSVFVFYYILKILMSIVDKFGYAPIAPIFISLVIIMLSEMIYIALTEGKIGVPFSSSGAFRGFGLLIMNANVFLEPLKNFLEKAKVIDIF